MQNDHRASNASEDQTLIVEIEERLRQLTDEASLESVAELDARFRAIPDTSDRPELVRLAVRLCTLWIYLGEPSRGVEISERAISWARRLSDPTSLQMALNIRAAVATDLVDIAGAIRFLLDALHVSESSNNTVGIVTSFHNISLNLLHLGMGSLAIQFAELGLHTVHKQVRELLADEASLYETILEFIVGSAHAEAGDPRKALRSLRRVQSMGEHLLPGLRPHDRMQLLAYMQHAKCLEIHVALQLGMLEEARGLVAQLDFSAGRPTSAELDRKMVLAQLSAAEGRYDEAITELQGILQGPCGHRLMHTIGFVLAECYNKLGRHTEAMAALRAVDVDMRMRRNMVAIERLRNRTTRGQTADSSFERKVDHSLSRTSLSIHADELSRASRLSSLVAMAISAEADEILSRDGLWHPIRVGALAQIVSSRLGLSEARCRHAEVAGWLHDLGKCAMPDKLKLKSGPLSPQEWDLIQEHSELGARLVDALGDSELTEAVAAIRHHHERFDGGGYPTRLAGDAIPVVARVVAICDSFDVMLMSKRYRPSRTLNEAMDELQRNSGSQFDPVLVAILGEVVFQLENEPPGLVKQLEQLGKASAPVECFERVERLVARRERTRE